MKKCFSIFVVAFTMLVVVPFTTKAETPTSISYGAWIGANTTKLAALDVDDIAKSMTGFQFGLMADFDLPFITLAPEIWYVRGNSTIGGFDVSSNSIDVPILVTTKFLDLIRVKAGPSFSLYNNAHIHYDNGNRLDVDRVKPTIGYVLGAGIEVYSLMLDLRFNGQFSTQTSMLGVEIDTTQSDLRTYSLSINLGYRF